MAQIDIRECTIKIFDGTLGTATIDFTAPNSDMTFTAKSKHVGSDKISITVVDPGGTTATLGIVVDGHEITVNLGRATSAVNTTAAALKAAIEGDTAANALVTVTHAGGSSGAGLLNAKSKTTLDGQNHIDVKIGEGNLTYSEKRPVEFVRDRGTLDTVKLADEEPIDVSLDAMWEWITAESGSSAPTIEDVLKKIGEAAAWLTTADDDCQPDCVDIELWNAPGCGSLDDEIIVFEEFYYETCDHDVREGTIAVSGRCNRVIPNVRRVLNANIEG